MSDDFANRIRNTLADSPGLKANQIADKLGVERRKVTSALNAKLRPFVLQDNKYRWYLLGDGTNVGGRGILGPNDELPSTPLAQLCRYYLDCLSHDDRDGVSVFATTKYEPDYCELTAWPFGQDVHVPFAESEVRAFVNRALKSTDRKNLYLGYPVFVRKVRTMKGSSTVVEPFFLFQYDVGAGHSGGASAIAGDVPWINPKPLHALPKAVGEGPQQEAIRLTELLGLDKGTVNPVEFDEVVDRLRAERSDWRWIEDPDPYRIPKHPRLSRVSEAGLYNRAILVLADKPTYTVGLESELKKLMVLKEEQYSDTALGRWLTGHDAASSPLSGDLFLEVVPLNTEQRAATRQGLISDLTVVTGPPGTGKSQIVTSLLANAAWSGTKVLFCSRNNKAVDVVEKRVNSLGSRSVLLRLGRSEHHIQLADYLSALLSAPVRSVSSDFADAQIRRRSILSSIDDLEAQSREVIEQRNLTDRLEPATEPAREIFGEERLRRLVADPWIDHFTADADRLALAVKRVTRRHRVVFMKALWDRFHERRIENLARVAARTRDGLAELGVTLPDARPSYGNMEAWRRAAADAMKRTRHLRDAIPYFNSLRKLNGQTPLEVLDKKRHQLHARLVPASRQVWMDWLDCLPSSLSQKDRQALGSYLSLVKLRGHISAMARDLLPSVAKFLPCWALTNLTARRFPFDPAFFDIVVVDEASQCDIASALPLLYRAKRAVIIGDPRQLRHITQIGKQQDERLLERHGLLTDHLRWSYSVNSLYDLASYLCRAGDVVGLRDHHRSHAHVIGFSNEYFYEGTLRVATSYDSLDLIDSGPAVRWRHVRGYVNRHKGTSALNELEAREVVVELERLILEQGYRGSVGLVTPFRAQANRIKQLVAQNAYLSEALTARGFIADTAHGFQGDERDLIVLSPVAARGISDSALWFLKRNGYLFNVAITRARSALRVIGDYHYAASSDVDYLASFSDYVRRINQSDAGEDNKREAFYAVGSLGPEYPSVANPEQVSDWERIFYRALCREGIRTIPQYPVEKYRLDLALIDGERKLNIEVDGKKHHRAWDGELLRSDQLRNARMIELGWDVMRFWVYQIRDCMDESVARVKEWLESPNYP